jgi:hypothetical protein
VGVVAFVDLLPDGSNKRGVTLKEKNFLRAKVKTTRRRSRQKGTYAQNH